MDIIQKKQLAVGKVVVELENIVVQGYYFAVKPTSETKVCDKLEPLRVSQLLQQDGAAQDPAASASAAASAPSPAAETAPSVRTKQEWLEAILQGLRESGMEELRFYGHDQFAFVGYERGVVTRRPETVSDYLESLVYDQEVPQHVRDYLNRLLDRA